MGHPGTGVSSTNRGAQRQEFDYYITPQGPIRTFLQHFKEQFPNFTPQRILDPCAGGNTVEVKWQYKKDKLVTIPPTEMSYPKVLAEVWPDARIVTMDIREDSPAQLHADFLKVDSEKLKKLKLDMVITNPPFSLAEEIIRKSLDIVGPDGFVIMLLRLNFFGSEERKDLFETFMPCRAFVHRKRMKFVTEGSGDSIEYMHAVWAKGEFYREETILRII